MISGNATRPDQYDSLILVESIWNKVKEKGKKGHFSQSIKSPLWTLGTFPGWDQASHIAGYRIWLMTWIDGAMITELKLGTARAFKPSISQAEGLHESFCQPTPPNNFFSLLQIVVIVYTTKHSLMHLINVCTSAVSIHCADPTIIVQYVPIPRDLCIFMVQSSSPTR